MTERLIDILASLLLLMLSAPFMSLSALNGGCFRSLGANDTPPSLESIIAPHLYLENVFKGRRSMRMMQPLPSYVVFFHAGVVNIIPNGK